MSRKSSYRISFEFMEGQLLGVGLELEHTIKVFNGEVRAEDMKCTMASYSRRYDWIIKILNELEIIREDVNLDTKKIIDMLYVRGESFDYVTEVMDISRKRLIRQHTLIIDEMMELLGMEVQNKTKNEKTDRAIPISVKREVFERDEGKCASCKSDGELHYHHIKRFADGGTHSVYNLTLLCASCHAEEHKGERSYHMLRKMAERV